MFLEECGERFAGHALELHVLQLDRQLAIFLERNEDTAQFGIAAMFEQAFLELALLHLRRRIERSGQIAMLGNQLARGFRSDAEDTGDVVDRIAHQREHVAHFLGRDAELLLDLLDIDARALHRVEHVDARAVLFADELHQVLVAGDDGNVPALRLCLSCIGGDHVVRFDVRFFDAGQAEGACRIADKRELRHKVFGRIGAIGLVLVVNLVAEGLARLVEDDRQMRRPVRLVQIGGQLPQHGGVAVDCTHRGPFGVGQRRQAVIGPEDIGGAIDEIEVLFIGHRASH